MKPYFLDQKPISLGNCCNKDKAYQATQHEKNLQIRPSGYKFTLLAQPERVHT